MVPEQRSLTALKRAERFRDTFLFKKYIFECFLLGVCLLANGAQLIQCQ